MSGFAAKLRVKPNTVILALDAPGNYEEVLGELPVGVKISYQLKDKHDFIHLFVTTQEDLSEVMPLIMEVLAPGGNLWVSFPKASSKLQKDLTRDKGWDAVMKYGIRWVNIAAYDHNWSSYGFVNLPKKEPSKQHLEYLELQKKWTDPVAKTVTIPDDFQAALDADPKTRAFFNGMTFSQRREFTIWILEAKGADTRVRRIEKAMEKLAAGKKNTIMR